jgi:hypothetical protein
MRLGVFLAVLLGAVPALVEAKNPTILIKDPPPPATIITGDTFGFSANSQGGGAFVFQNGTGNDWVSMNVSATLSRLTAIDCNPGPFLTCAVATTPVSGGFMYDILFGAGSNGGIRKGEVFTISLDDQGSDPNGVGSWAPGRDFDSKVTFAAPEPASLLLMLAGGLLVLGVLKFRPKQITS